MEDGEKPTGGVPAICHLPSAICFYFVSLAKQNARR